MKNNETLKMNYEFKNVLDKGKYYINNQVIIYIMKNNLEYNRYGIAINSKLCNAVKRNHLKRLIREGYRKFEANIRKSYDIVLMWNKKTNINEASYKVICDNIEKSFSKAGIL